MAMGAKLPVCRHKTRAGKEMGNMSMMETLRKYEQDKRARAEEAERKRRETPIRKDGDKTPRQEGTKYSKRD